MTLGRTGWLASEERAHRRWAENIGQRNLGDPIRNGSRDRSRDYILCRNSLRSRSGDFPIHVDLILTLLPTDSTL